MVDVFFRDEVLRRKIGGHLSQCYDMARALQRLSLNRDVGGPRDLRQIGATLERAMALKKDLEGTMFACLPWGNHDSLARELLTAITDEGIPSRPSEGGLIAAGYAASLDEMRRRSVDLREHIESLAIKLRQETGILDDRLYHIVCRRNRKTSHQLDADTGAPDPRPEARQAIARHKPSSLLARIGDRDGSPLLDRRAPPIERNPCKHRHRDSRLRA